MCFISRYLASSCSNGEVLIWDLAEGKAVSKIACSTSVVSLGWSKDSRFIYSASSSGYIKGYSLNDYQE